jgi:hypothetical protein
MRLPRPQMITGMPSRRRLQGGITLVLILSVSMVIFFERSDGRVPQWMFEVGLLSFDENTEKSEPDLAVDRRMLFKEQEGMGQSESFRELDSSDAYLQQFEHLGGAQWLPHSY